MKSQIEHVRQGFQSRFGGDPTLIASAPGRVNLIGEHTDYMGGWVLPVAIDKRVLFAVRATLGENVIGYSSDFNESVTFAVGQYDRNHPCRWLRYVLGVLKEIEQAGMHWGGFEFYLAGNVPMGSGLSSSAALEVAVAKAILSLYHHDLDKRQMALLCQRAENDFVGLQCGIMDQYISSAGIADHALKIDCASGNYEAVQAVTPGYTWLVIDSKKKRGLVDSEYNARRAQCHAGLEFLQAHFPDQKISNLRDVTLDQLEGIRDAVGAAIFKRLRHEISENLRVQSTCEALERGDLATVGRNLNASHQSLRDDFEVSCVELDALVEIVSGVEGVAGIRLTGAGFGGCAIALVRNDGVSKVREAVFTQYPHRFPLQAESVEIWPIQISEGASLVFSQASVPNITR